MSSNPIVYLDRYPSTDQGTLGRLTLPNGVELATIELPDRDNKPRVSRILAGRYRCTKWSSKKFGNVWILHDTKGRSYILIHKGNVAGDTALGFKTHSAGCILVGLKAGLLWGQLAVTNSGSALRKCHEALDEYDEFYIQIEDF
ncbi:hypothetical protein vBVhaSVHB1_26 [Vibrio phage vB_VhaS-VHB1]|nr:hypothetical protein vBVhaSVHB1_26 [Vibrio phage vB_VhaS-VHB1]